MQCSSCGSQLQPGATTCPTCGMPTPYNVPAQGPYQEGSASQYDPTVFASPSGSSPQYGTPPQYDPAVAPPPFYGTPSRGQGTPPSTYGSPPFGSPQANPYEATQPNAYPYAPPPPPQASYPQAPGGFIPQPSKSPRPQRNRTGLILGILALIIVLIGAGIFGVLVLTAKNKQTQGGPTATPTASTTAPTSTPTQATQSASPSGSPIDSTASGILTNAQTASAVDSNARPTQLSSTFAVQQIIYATFDLHLNGQTGYAVAKWYADGQLGFTSNILNINDPTAPDGYFAGKFNIATKNGSVELYWCTQSNCSDATLAAVVNFTVS